MIIAVLWECLAGNFIQDILIFISLLLSFDISYLSWITVTILLFKQIT